MITGYLRSRYCNQSQAVECSIGNKVARARRSRPTTGGDNATARTIRGMSSIWSVAVAAGDDWYSGECKYTCNRVQLLERTRVVENSVNQCGDSCPVRRFRNCVLPVEFERSAADAFGNGAAGYKTSLQSVAELIVVTRWPGHSFRRHTCPNPWHCYRCRRCHMWIIDKPPRRWPTSGIRGAVSRDLRVRLARDGSRSVGRTVSRDVNVVLHRKRCSPKIHGHAGNVN